MIPLQLDLSWILAFQSLGDWLVLPMKFSSFLGTEEFYTLILPILYWCIDASLGLRVGVVMLFSSGVNFIVKLPFRGPRPYWISSGVKPLWAETSFGIPSGHAQNAISVWGMMASYIRRAWVWVPVIFIMFMISLSRAYLGAHFFQDIFAGWIIGILILWFYLRYWDKVAAWAEGQTLRRQAVSALLVSLGMVVIGWLLVTTNQNYAFPQEWVANASRIGDELPAPVSLDGILTSAGTLFGLLVGVAWMASRGGWQVSGPVWKRAARYVVGVLGVLVIWNGLGTIFPRGAFLLAYALRYIRYSLLGLWVAAGAPWTFTKLKL